MLQDKIVEKIKRLRKEKNITQEEMASLTGVTRRTLSRLESGEGKEVSVQLLEKITIALGTNPAEFLNEFYGEDPNANKTQQIKEELIKAKDIIDNILIDVL